MKLIQKKLNNQITLCYISQPSAHSFNIGLYFPAGTLYESKKDNGISHLLEHMLFRKNKLSQKNFYDSINKIGGTLKGCTYPEYIRLDFQASPQHFQSAFSLVCNFLSDFVWTEDEIELEKSVIIKQIQFNSPPSFEEYIRNSYFKGKTIGLPIMGTERTLESLTADRVMLWKQRCLQPSQLLFVITGNVTADDIDFAESILNRYQPEYRPIIQKKSVIPDGFMNRTYKSDKLYKVDDTISDIVISFDLSLPDFDQYCANMLSCILGQGDGSKLSILLRETYAYTDEVYSKIEFYHDIARFVISLSVNQTNVIPSLTEIFSVLNYAKQCVSENDFSRNIRFFTDNQFILDDVRGLNDWVAWQQFVLQNRNITIDELTLPYQKITCKTLSKAASQLFRPENLIVSLTYNSAICKRKELINLLQKIRCDLKNN